ncbi:MAG: serine protease, partial [Candidatus Eremiobacteraeota bacterium]|nr:serine protease [Candidatus Eremiobacteraeota bacterium]
MRCFSLAILLIFLAACSQKSADPFVGAVKSLRPSVVLLTMQVPSENKRSWDDAYASGFVVASGPWGSDILTVQHAISGARKLHVTIENKRRVPGRIAAENPSLDIAIISTKTVLPAARLGDSDGLQAGEMIGVMGYPIPDAFEEEGLGLQTSIDSGR